MKDIYDFVVLGGGAGGLTASIKLKEHGKSVAIIDENVNLGKKLLVTGNGRCNLTNLNVSSKNYNRNIDKFLNRFGVKETLKFFKSLGIETYSDEEGRVYPLSNSAKTIQFILQNKIKELNIDCFTNEKILSVVKTESNFIIQTTNLKLVAKNIVVATGGKSKEFLKSFDIKYVKEMPSLVSLKTKEITKNINGVKVEVEVSAEVDGLTKSEEGEVLFKDSGLSGIVIFNISNLFARAKNFNGKIYLDLFPKKSENELYNMLLTRKSLKFNILEGILCHELAIYVYERLKIDNKGADRLSDIEIKNIVRILKRLEFNVCGFYDNNQVVSGGVDLNELTDNLEHKKIKGLYFIGECVDIDGDCGGYNLQWAWTSSAIVGGCN